MRRECVLQPRSARVDDVRLSAAKDRTFKTVRSNQGPASGTVPIRRRQSSWITRTVPADDPLTQIAAGLEQVVILPRVTFALWDT